jgi:hypothetical protein
MQILRSEGMQWPPGVAAGRLVRPPKTSRPAEDRNQLVLVAGATNQ